MTEHKNIAAALAAAQGEMKPPEKNAENPAFKRDGKPMKYADLTSVVESVRGPLTKHGICWGWRSVEFMGALAKECYLKHGASETELTCTVPMHLDRQNMHGLKSAYTYAKRIGLESLTGQAPADDDDGNAASEHMAKSAPAPRQQSKPAPDHSQAAQPEKKERDPQAIADGIIKAINECGDLDAIKTLFGADTRASAAWDWLAMEAHEHSKRVNQAKAAREAALQEAPF